MSDGFLASVGALAIVTAVVSLAPASVWGQTSASGANAAKAAATDVASRHPEGPEDLSNVLRCITYGVPRLGGNFGAGIFGYYQIQQTPRYVVLVTESIHEARIIPLDGRAHLPSSIRQWNGDP